MEQQLLNANLSHLDIQENEQSRNSCIITPQNNNKEQDKETIQQQHIYEVQGVKNQGNNLNSQRESEEISAKEREEYHKRIENIINSNKIIFTSPQTNQVIIRVAEKQNKNQKDIQVIKKAIESLPIFFSRESFISDAAVTDTFILSLSKTQLLHQLGETNDTFYMLLEVVAQKRISQAQEDIDKKNERIQLNDSVLIQNYLKLSEKQPDVVQYDPSMNFHSLFPDSYAIKRLEIGAAFGDLSLLTNKRMMCSIVCGSDCKFLAMKKTAFLTVAIPEDKEQFEQRLKAISQISFLEKVPIFKIILLLQYSTITIAKLGQKIYKFGDPSNNIYFLEKGSIQISKKKENVSHTNTRSIDQSEYDIDELNINESRKNEKNSIKVSSITILDEGQYFGEEEVLKGEQTRLSEVTVVSRYATIVQINKDMLFWITREEGGLHRLFLDCEMKSKFKKNQKHQISEGIIKTKLDFQKKNSKKQIFIQEPTEDNVESVLLAEQSPIQCIKSLSPFRNSNNISPQLNQLSPSHSKISSISNLTLKYKSKSVANTPSKLTLGNSFANFNFSPTREQFPLIQRGQSNVAASDFLSADNRDSFMNKDINFFLNNESNISGEQQNKKKSIIFSQTTRNQQNQQDKGFLSQRRGKYEQQQETVAEFAYVNVPNNQASLDFKRYYERREEDEEDQHIQSVQKFQDKSKTVKQQYQQLSTFQKIKVENNKLQVRKQQLESIADESIINQSNQLIPLQSTQNSLIFSQVSNQKPKINILSSSVDPKPLKLINKNIISTSIFLNNRISHSRNSNYWNNLLTEANDQMKIKETNGNPQQSSLQRKTESKILKESLSLLLARNPSLNKIDFSQHRMVSEEDQEGYYSNTIREDIGPQLKNQRRNSKRKSTNQPNLDLLSSIQKNEQARKLIRSKSKIPFNSERAIVNTFSDLMKSTMGSFPLIKQDEEQDRLIMNGVYQNELSPKMQYYQTSENDNNNNASPYRKKRINLFKTQSADDFMKQSFHQSKSPFQSALSSPSNLKIVQLRDEWKTHEHQQQFQNQKQKQKQIQMWQPQPQSQIMFSLDGTDTLTNDKRKNYPPSIYNKLPFMEKTGLLKEKQTLLSFKKQPQIQFGQLIKEKIMKDDKIVNFHTFSRNQLTEPQKSYIKMKQFSPIQKD